MKKIKVLLLMYCIRPAGAEKVVLSIASNLNRNKYEVVVCTFKNGELYNEFAKLNIPFYILNKKNRVDIKFIWKLIRLIRKEKIVIIHSHNFSANFWGRLVGYLARVPILITTEHTVATTKSALQKYIDYYLSKITDKIIAVSKNVKDSHVEEEGIKSETIVTIYNGIEPHSNQESEISLYRSKLLNELGIDCTNMIIVTVGRLEPPKGYQYLLNAIPIVKKVYPQARFVFVGAGSLKNKLEETAIKLNIRDKVIFTGFRADATNILSAFDLCVIPSIREGFSITLLEAMSVGTPIVATDVGGNSEAIVNKESGLIVPPKDPKLLASSIIEILKNKTMSEKIGKKAKERYLANFTVTKMIDNTEKLYENLFRLKILKKH